MLAIALLAGSSAGFTLPGGALSYAPPLQASIQNWELPTLREAIKKGQVQDVGIYVDQTSVEVLDTNGLQRQVALFPEAMPYLVDDLKAANVHFFVFPETTPAMTAAAFLATLGQALFASAFFLVLCRWFGMLEPMIFVMSLLPWVMTMYAEAVAAGFELTVLDAKAALGMQPEAKAIRVPAEKKERKDENES